MPNNYRAEVDELAAAIILEREGVFLDFSEPCSVRREFVDNEALEQLRKDLEIDLDSHEQKG